MEKVLSWTDAVIRDGFTQSGYISEVEGLHPAVRFKFRPLIPEEVEDLEAMRDAVTPRTAKDVRAKIGEALAKQLVAWDVKFDDKPAPINSLNVRSLRTSAQTKIYNIVAGFMPTEADPTVGTDLDEELASLEELRSAEAQLGKS